MKKKCLLSIHFTYYTFLGHELTRRFCDYAENQALTATEPRRHRHPSPHDGLCAGRRRWSRHPHPSQVLQEGHP